MQIVRWERPLGSVRALRSARDSLPPLSACFLLNYHPLAIVISSSSSSHHCVHARSAYPDGVEHAFRQSSPHLPLFYPGPQLGESQPSALTSPPRRMHFSMFFTQFPTILFATHSPPFHTCHVGSRQILTSFYTLLSFCSNRIYQ